MYRSAAVSQERLNRRASRYQPPLSASFFIQKTTAVRSSASNRASKTSPGGRGSTGKHRIKPYLQYTLLVLCSFRPAFCHTQPKMNAELKTSQPHPHPRIAYARVAPQAIHVLRSLEDYVANCGLEPGLVELAKLRASQINGCAYCIDKHTKDARAHGETEQRLYALSVWAETPFYSERERAVLAWTEAVTQVSTSQVPDSVYELARAQFDEKALVDLTMAIIAINSWNRLAVSFRTVPGTYEAGAPKEVKS